MTRRRHSTHVIVGLALVAVLAIGSTRAFAQDEGEPSPQEIQEKIRQIEKLMKQAEQSLARSTGTARSRDDSAEAAKRLEEILDQKSQEQTGKSAQELRKAAQDGSAEAAEALKTLMQEAQSEAAKAGAEMEKLLEEGGGSSKEATEGVRKLLEETQRSGQQAQEGIRWLLENAVSKGGQGGSGGKPQKQKPGEGEQDKPEKPGDSTDKQEKDNQDPQPTGKKPEHDLDPPRKEEFEVWLAELPPEVRRAYESQDWDAIPVKWRGILRSWTKKMADELERDR